MESPPALEAAASGFNPATAWWLAELSRLIYRRECGETDQVDGPGRGGFLRAVGLREARSFRWQGTQAALVEPTGASGTAQFAALIFRGTQGLRNNLSNLNAIPVRWPGGGRVHRGFRWTLERIWDEIEACLGAVDLPIVYAGHSLGAALATLAASRRPPAALYTFGSPRVGNARFVETLAGVPAFRIVNGRDMVTTVPPWWWPWRFRHVGALHRLAYRCGRPERRLLDPPPFLSDHAPVNYVANVEA